MEGAAMHTTDAAENLLCPLYPDLFEDKRIGSGDFLTGEEHAVIYSEHSLLFPFGQSSLTNYFSVADAARRLYPFLGSEVSTGNSSRR